MITLFDLIIDASAVLLVTFVTAFFLRRRSAALRHWVLSAGLLCAGLAPAAELIVPEWTLPFDVPIVEGVAPPAAAVLSGAGGTEPATAPQFQATTDTSAPGLSLVDWLTRVWFAGFLACLTVPLVGLGRLAFLTKRTRPVTDGVWAHRLAALKEAYRIREPIQLRESPHPRLLLVWGWRRPTLIIPTTARTWSEDRVVAVLRHELAHVQRNDWLTQLASEVVRAIHWFNPLVWIACARLHVEREQACDDAVIAAGIAGSSYAEHLLEVARDLRHGSLWAPAPAIVRASTLERRVRAMLDRTTDRRPLSQRGRTASLAMLLAASLAVVTIAAAQQFASITGTIVDPTNGLLPGVTLVLTNEQTKAKYEITSDKNGRYEFVGLPSGTYSLESKLPGFAVFRGTVTVSGKAVEQNLMLSIGELEETISIVGSDRPESPEEQRARLERKLTDQEKVAAYKQKRAAQRCPAGVTSASGSAIGGNLRPPLKLVDVRPVYPERLRGNDGDVVLSAIVGLDGTVDRVDVVSASDPAFANSAIDAVKQWQFDATLLNCSAVETSMKVSLTYRWR